MATTKQRVPDRTARWILRFEREHSTDIVDAILLAMHGDGWTYSALSAMFDRQASYARNRILRTTNALQVVDMPMPNGNGTAAAASPAAEATRSRNRSRLSSEEKRELHDLGAQARKVRGGTPPDSPNRHAAEKLASKVRAYNERGVSWATLADELGISQQAVRNRAHSTVR